MLCIVTVKFCCIKTRPEMCSRKLLSVIVVCFFSFIKLNFALIYIEVEDLLPDLEGSDKACIIMIVLD